MSRELTHSSTDDRRFRPVQQKIAQLFGSARWVLLAVFGLACGSAPARPLPPAPRVSSAQAILPADLDARMWFDLTRLRDLWSFQPNQQLANVLREYGVMGSGRAEQDAVFWLHLLSRSDKLWVACRPSLDGCRDTVVFARGNFRKYEPTAALPEFEAPVDLGAGWLRYDRRGQRKRDEPARIYLSPPDRCIVTPTAELDALERSLERGVVERAPVVEERGLFSIAARPEAVAALLEQRSPSAARLMRAARTLKLWLEANQRELVLVVVIAFDSQEQAERARLAVTLVVKAIGMLPEAETDQSATIERVDRELVLRARFKAGAQPPPAERRTNSEPAAE